MLKQFSYLQPRAKNKNNAAHPEAWDGLVAFYPFLEGGGDTVRDLIRRNDGAITGGTWVPEGLNFNGSSDYVDCGGASELNPLGPFSIVVWIRPDTLEYNADIMSKTGGGNDDTHHIMLRVGNDMRFYVGGVNSVNSAQYANFLVIGELYCLVGVWTGAATQLYVNGKYISSAATPVAPDVSGSNLFIGTRNGGSYHFGGTIPAAFLYNCALTPDQISQIYALKLAYWLERRMGPSFMSPTAPGGLSIPVAMHHYKQAGAA